MMIGQKYNLSYSFSKVTRSGDSEGTFSVFESKLSLSVYMEMIT